MNEQELTQEIINAAIQSQKDLGLQPSVEDMAAYDYQNLIPQFKEKLDELNTRSLIKVINALVEYPLAAQQFRWSYQHEKEAFNMGMKIFDCKFVIMRAVLEMKKEEINKLLNETSTAQDVGTLPEIAVQSVETNSAN